MSSTVSLPSSQALTVPTTCLVCLRKLKKCELGKPKTCGHIFCFTCIHEWSKVSPVVNIFVCVTVCRAVSGTSYCYMLCFSVCPQQNVNTCPVDRVKFNIIQVLDNSGGCAREVRDAFAHQHINMTM